MEKEALQRQMYKVQVIPHIESNGQDADGKPKVKTTYIRTTNPNAKTLAIVDDNGKPVFGKQKTMWLEVFRQGSAGKLDVDNRPFTVNIFENSDSTLFEAIEEMVNDEAQHTVKDTARKPMVLNELMPGLVRVRKAPAHYATRNNAEGVAVRLRANRINRKTGDPVKEDVILESVSYFLFAGQVDNETDEVRYRTELARIHDQLVKATDLNPGEIAAALEKEGEEA